MRFEDVQLSGKFEEYSSPERTRYRPIGGPMTTRLSLDDTLYPIVSIEKTAQMVRIHYIDDTENPSPVAGFLDSDCDPFTIAVFDITYTHAGTI